MANLILTSSEDIYNIAFAKEIAHCKGLIYRGRVSVFQTKYGIAVKKEVRFLKKKSCPGCSSCEAVSSQIDEFMDGKYDYAISGIQDGKLYELRVTNVSRDWETGWCDYWDLEFVEIKE